MRGKSLWVVAIASLAAAGTLLGGKKDESDDVLKKLQGTW